MASSRRQETTQWIRQAAISEFTHVGARAFSLGGLADAAHISKGAVYQRWSDKTACITDLISIELPLYVDELGQGWKEQGSKLDHLIEMDLTTTEDLTRLRFITECLLLACTDETFTRPVLDEVEKLKEAFASLIPDAEYVPAIKWWATCTYLGYALLHTTGCPVPPSFVSAVSSLLQVIGACARDAESAFTIQGGKPEVEAFFRLEHHGDAAARDLLTAAQELIEQRGIAESDTRAIAQGAGMTTGALYRRFDGKSELLAEAFRNSLGNERYEWSEEFLTRLGAGDYWGTVDTLVNRITQTWTDRTTARRLIDFTIAAHTDQRILTAILQEIVSVTDHRIGIFSALQTEGIVHPGLSPEDLAWLIQVPSVGMRILGWLGNHPSDAQLQRLMGAYLVFLIRGHEPTRPPEG